MTDNSTHKISGSLKIIKGILLWGLIISAMYVSSLYSYLVFHTFVEFFSIIIAFCTFTLAYNTRQYMKNNYLYFIGISYLFVGSLDTLHTLTYKGMDVIHMHRVGVATEIWVATRYVESISLLVAPIFLYREKIKDFLIFAIYTCISVMIFISIFLWNSFPACYVEGLGLTAFKKNSEYIVCFILIASLFLLIKNKRFFDKEVIMLLTASIVFTILTELCFTLYVGLYDYINILGHCLKVISYYFIYRAIIVTGMNKPFDLLFRDLNISKVEAEKANRAKSDFMANMSHEIRTPMNTIIGMTDLAMEMSADVKQKEYLAIVKGSADSLLSIINEILDIMKIESGKLELESVNFSIKAVVAAACNMFAILAKNKGLTLNYNVSPEVPDKLNGDPTRLRQILINLTGNALKYTTEGGIDVNLNVSNEQTQAGRVSLIFSVKDTGIGIAHDRQEMIFERFTQADSSTTRKYGGSGLGLTICKEIVHLMGGRIWVESETNKGSTFYFTITLKKADAPAGETLYNQKPQALTKQRRKFRILIADDIEENILLLQIRLQQYGHTTIVARNGQEAVNCFKREKADLILMDIQMPVMDGLEATRQIRKIESSTGGHITIIALTAGVMAEEKASYLTKGIDAVADKPIETEKLLSIIESSAPEGIGEIYAKQDAETVVTSECKIQSIDGIDINKGISVWRDAQTYKKALKGFTAKYRDSADKILSLIEDNNIEEAYRIAHSMSGLTGILSMTEVYPVVRQLSLFLRELNLNSAKEQATLLRGLLRTVTDSISTMEVQEEEPLVSVSTSGPNMPVVREIIIRLLKSFDEYNPDDVEPVMLELQTALNIRQVKPIKKYVEELDFAMAKAETIKLAGELAIVMEVQNDGN
ncbi:MAG: ATP-binding protein [Nitrospirae bacterium YQR-1]